MPRGRVFARLQAEKVVKTQNTAFAVSGLSDGLF
nr:MAG TPA: hypothetical protein [Caudoviricetes sp.]